MIGIILGVITVLFYLPSIVLSIPYIMINTNPDEIKNLRDAENWVKIYFKNYGVIMSFCSAILWYVIIKFLI